MAERHHALWDDRALKAGFRVVQLRHVPVLSIEVDGREHEYIVLTKEMHEAFQRWPGSMRMTFASGVPGLPAADFEKWQDAVERYQG